MISQTDSLVRWAPTGVSNKVLRTWNSRYNCTNMHTVVHDLLRRWQSKTIMAVTVLTKQTGHTCRIFIRTTSSLAGSVPTNLACVTASAMFSMASAAASWLASANRQQTQKVLKQSHCRHWRQRRRETDSQTRVHWWGPARPDFMLHSLLFIFRFCTAGWIKEDLIQWSQNLWWPVLIFPLLIINYYFYCCRKLWHTAGYTSILKKYVAQSTLKCRIYVWKCFKIMQ